MEGEKYKDEAPKPFCSNVDKVIAFVLGCDPTAFDKNGNRLEFEFVFDLGNDERYFKGVIENLRQVGLFKKNV